MSKDRPRTAAEKVGDLVDERVRKLQQGAVANTSAEIAALARLRRAVGKPVGSMLDVLQYTMDPVLVVDRRDDKPSRGEVAAHTCITLYAAHQQSRAEGMHQRGPQHHFGKAIRALTNPGAGDVEPNSPVTRRFQALGTATSFDELTYHARGLIQQLRAHGIKLDYHQFAMDLFNWQFPDRADRVRLAWGRDFYLYRPSKDSEPKADPAEQTTTDHDSAAVR